MRGLDSEVRREELPLPERFELLLIGAVLVKPEQYFAAVNLVRGEHFADAMLGAAWDKIGELLASGNPVSPMVLARYGFSHDFFTDLANNTILVHEVPYVARVVRNLAVRRALRRAAAEITLLADDGSNVEDTEELLTAADGELRVAMDFAERSGSALVHIATAIERAAQQAEDAKKRGTDVVGTPTGIRSLDERLGGLSPGNLIVLGGRPSMGKTTLALNIANAAAKEGAVLFSSLEMSADELGQRELSTALNIPPDAIRRGQPSFELIGQSVGLVSLRRNLPLWIDETPSVSTSHIRLRARRLMSRNGGRLALLVVDHLQLIREAERLERRLEIGRITRNLKALAKELEVPVLVLSQLSRHNEKSGRHDRRPLLSDLRESGDIEQDADVVLFVHREEYYVGRDRPDEPETSTSDRMNAWRDKRDRLKGLAEIIIAKNRQGPTDTVELAYDYASSKFADLEEPEPEQGGMPL